jgi:hypothetical protein
MIAFATVDAQLPLGMVICTLFTFGVLRFNPFLRAEDDLLQLFAQCEIYLLLLAGFVFYQSSVSSISSRDDIIMSVSLIVICIAFFIGFLYFIIKAARALLLEFLGKRAARKIKEEAKAARTAMMAKKAATGAEFGEEEDDEPRQHHDMDEEEAGTGSHSQSASAANASESRATGSAEASQQSASSGGRGRGNRVMQADAAPPTVPELASGSAGEDDEADADEAEQEGGSASEPASEERSASGSGGSQSRSQESEQE